MQYDILRSHLKQSAAVKLLQSQNGPLILGFLYDQFKQKQQIAIPHTQLVESLEAYIESINESYPDQYKQTADSYLKQWCDEKSRFLRRYFPANRDDPVYELTADTEQTLIWLDSSQKSEFVGTESRFLRIFDLLNEIVMYSTGDVEARLEQLEQQKAEIQAQIDRIKTTGNIEQFSDTQIKERFFEANDTARRLLADFQEVEENFQAIVREVQQQQLVLDARKGQIVEHVLDADQLLKESDQGRSFYSFWEFLMSSRRQDELQKLLAAVYELPEVSALDGRQSSQLRRLKRSLIDAASKIIESNRRLGEQLRKLLNEQNMAEARRVIDLAQEIKKLAIELADTRLPRTKDFFELEGDPLIVLPIERPLWTPPIQINYANVELPEVLDDRLTADDLASLYNQFYIDKSVLKRQIATLLETRPTVSLAELIAVFPLKQGLAELVTYLLMAEENRPDAAGGAAHGIDESVWEAIPLDEDGRMIRIPRVVFSR